MTYNPKYLYQTNQPASQPANQPVSQAINQRARQPANQPAKTSQPTSWNQPTSQADDESERGRMWRQIAVRPRLSLSTTIVSQSRWQINGDINRAATQSTITNEIPITHRILTGIQLTSIPTSECNRRLSSSDIAWFLSLVTLFKSFTFCIGNNKDYSHVLNAPGGILVGLLSICQSPGSRHNPPVTEIVP